MNFGKILSDKAYQIFKPPEVSNYDRAKTLILGITDLPTPVRNNLAKYGDGVIQTATVVRTPLSSVITGLLNTLTGAEEVMKRENYDKLFHLAIIFQTSKGKVLLEKNEGVNLTTNIKISQDAEQLELSVPPNLTLNEVFANTEKYMTRDKFLKYSAYDNNCQDFIVAVMKSNNIGNEGDIQFVKQNTEDIFRTNPKMRKFANTLTDIAGRFTGGKVRKRGGMVVKSLPYTPK